LGPANRTEEGHFLVPVRGFREYGRDLDGDSTDA